MNTLTLPTSTFDPLTAKRQLAPMVQFMLAKVYEGGIFRLTNLQSDTSGDITGNAVGNDRKFLDFEINFTKNQLTFSESVRHDSYSEGLALIKFDAGKFRQPKCKVGIRCKGTCIERGKKCRHQLSEIVPPLQLRRMKQVSLMSAGVNSGDDYENKNIRELQELARKKDVYRANHQSKQELINTLRTLDKDPQSQDRLRKTIEKRQKSRKILEQSLPGQLAKYWRNFKQIGKAAGVSPGMGGVAAAVFLMGVSTSVYNQARDRYRSGLNDSANMAFERAQKIPLDNVNKPNVMFAVGGFGGTGSNGQKMKELLETPSDNTKGEQWFGKGNHIIPFTHKETDIPTPAVSKYKADGSYNPAYLGAVAKDGFGKFAQNFGRGRNEAAVDLASQLYAYGTKYKDKGLNVLGHGAAPTDEAIEILSRMPKGKEIAQRLNLVRMGTPSFGFTNDKSWDKDIKHRTITSEKDPFSFLPKKASQWISKVKGHEVDDYLKEPEVRERLREAFNYYSSSITGHQAAEARKKEGRAAIGEALNLVSPSYGKLWNQLNRVADLGKKNPAAAGILAGVVVTGASAATYNQMRRNYKAGLKYSAMEATKIAELEKQKLRSPGGYVRHNNATFVVGGVGFAAKDIKDNLPEELQNSHFVEVDGSVAAAGNANIGDLNPGSAGYNTHVVANGYGTHLNKNIKESLPVVGSGKIQNPEAVQLAAQMYAMADTKFGAKGKGRKVDVNVIAGGDGGLVAREAMEIIQKMPNGAAVASRIRVATLGTPTFGIADESTQEKNITGVNDPVSKLPHQPSPISVTAPGVEHHSAKSYVQDKQVQAEMKAHFARPKPQLTQTEIQERERKARVKEAEQKRQQTEAEEQQKAAQREAQRQQSEQKRQMEEAKKAQRRQQREQQQAERYKIENLPAYDRQRFLESNPNWNPENPEDAAKLLNFIEKNRRRERKIKKIQEANKPKPKPKPKSNNDSYNDGYLITVQRLDRLAKKRPEKLQCRPGFEQRGAACQRIKPRKAGVAGAAIVGTALAAALLSRKAKNNQNQASDESNPVTAKNKLASSVVKGLATTPIGSANESKPGIDKKKLAVVAGGVAAAGAVGAGVAIAVKRQKAGNNSEAELTGTPEEKFKKATGVEWSEVKEIMDDIKTSVGDSTDLEEMITPGKGDQILKSIVKKRGFDKVPKTVSQQEMDELIKSGEQIESFRGVYGSGSDGDLSSQDMTNNFREGDFYQGLGVHGNGTYIAVGSHGKELQTSEKSREVALETANLYAGAGAGLVMRMGVPKKANLILKEDIKKKVQKLQEINFDDIPNLSKQEKVFLSHILKDPGCVAAMMGYDGIRVVNPEGKGEQGCDFISLVNRSILSVQQEDLKAQKVTFK